MKLLGRTLLLPILLIAATSAQALVRPMALPALVRESTVIAIGEVTGQQREDRDGRWYTRYTLNVSQWLKSPEPRPTAVLTVTVVGGQDSSGARQLVRDAPTYAVKEQVLCFLEPDPESPGAWRTTGYWQGKLTIEQDGSLREMPQRRLDELVRSIGQLVEKHRLSESRSKRR